VRGGAYAPESVYPAMAVELCAIGSALISTSTAPQRHWTFVIPCAPVSFL
jgi:hypothetical protein